MLLAAMMTATVVTGCSTPDGDGAASGDNAGDTSASDDAGDNTDSDIMTPYGKYPEPITLSIVREVPAAPNLLEGETVEDSVMTRYIMDKLNVGFEVEWEVDESQYVNKLSLQITSNSLPDMFNLTVNEYLLYKELYDNGMLADISDEYEACAGDFMKETLSTWDNKNFEAFTEDDGGLYALSNGKLTHFHNLLWLRQDWLDESGITELPESLDDIENILQTWKDAPPTADYAGMGLHATVVAGGYGVAYSASPIFHLFDAYPATWVENDEGEIIWGSTAPEMKEGLAVLADWYEKGLIDQEFATRTQTGSNDASFSGGQIGSAFVGWNFAYNIYDLVLNDPDAEIVPVNAPLDDEGNFKVIDPAPVDRMLLINAECEYPEAAIKTMNVQFDMWRGFDEEANADLQPSVENNVNWKYLMPTGGVNLEYAEIVPDLGIATKELIETGELPDNYVTEILSNVLLAETAAAYDPDSTETPETMHWINYHTRYVGSNMLKADNIIHEIPAYSFSTASSADLKPNLDTLEQTTFLKIVTGEEPLDAFDKFVEDWYAQGGQTLTDEVNAVAGN